MIESTSEQRADGHTDDQARRDAVRAYERYGSDGRTTRRTTIGLLVNDRPGVLMRVSQTFSRRGYNIESLVVSPAHTLPDTSRMTITCSGPGDVLHQIILQLDKLIDVIHARDHAEDEAVIRELAMFKVVCTVSQRSELLQIAEIFRAKTVDISDETITLEATGTTEKMDALEKLLSKFDLREMVRTGKVVMARGTDIT
ncbi:MAG: acetolactate synthase small subunit [Gemmatimonadetes bacterium]|jgi:acetolactate synthase I/III small subunit|nr:acetolactate synthase small subunit [Gemmatimonadota bacterium]MBT7859748.1 acetolactate synthase small subunit [Gemmatimonadota bacterium]